LIYGACRIPESNSAWWTYNHHSNDICTTEAPKHPERSTTRRCMRICGVLGSYTLERQMVCSDHRRNPLSWWNLRNTMPDPVFCSLEAHLHYLWRALSISHNRTAIDHVLPADRISYYSCLYKLVEASLVEEMQAWQAWDLVRALDDVDANCNCYDLGISSRVINSLQLQTLKQSIRNLWITLSTQCIQYFKASNSIYVKLPSIAINLRTHDINEKLRRCLYL
jgi:hypothetical protein